MTQRRLGISLVAGAVVGLWGSIALAKLPDCEPQTVLQHTTGERQAMILRALNFYSWYPGYSQGTCVNVVNGQQQATNFNKYYGGCDAKDWWRTDCSGFASFVWDVAKNYACAALGSGGDDGAGHTWSSKAYDDLEPGDALNKPDQHVMIFTGWLDDAHTKMCTIQELNDYQADHDGVVGCGTWSWKRSDLEGTYIPIGLDDVSRFNPTPAQSTANDFISFVNWPDGHAEAFVRTASHDLAHTYSQAGDDWSAPESLDSGVACGTTVNYWPHILKWASAAEVFTPRAAGGAGHLWWSNGDWNTLSPLGTKLLGHFQSVAHFDGNLEVFGLGSDGAIYSNYGDRFTDKWSDWQNLGGKFKTGASAIVWNDGHTELFATSADGTPAHEWTDGAQWSGWKPMSGNLASKPVPVRWPDGHVEVFARGSDGKLQHSTIQGSAWTAFEVIDATTEIEGDPSAIMNASGPEIFARSKDGKVVHLWWDGKAFTSFTSHLDQATAADPMGWIKNDGTAELFAVDPTGRLVHSHHAKAGWTPWSPVGDAIDDCADQYQPYPEFTSPSGGGPVSTGSGSSAEPDPAVEDDGAVAGSCACRAGAADGSPLSALASAMVAFGVIAVRRRRKAAR